MTRTTTHNVLIAGATNDAGRLLLTTLTRRAVRGLLVGESAEAMERLETSAIRMVFVELSPRPAERLRLLERIAREWPGLPVVAIVSEGDVTGAVQAVRAGAGEALTSPIDAASLEALLDRCLPDHDVPAPEEIPAGCYRIAGRSEALRQTVELAGRVARSSVPILITGESGTGKELISHLIHRLSPRAGNPYIRVNCAAISESLLESELFGHERGAFTGAYARRKGRFELAHSGTLLLDEISETGPRLQAELLRVLEEQDFERLGGHESVNVDVRVICTSNRDLEQEVRRGRFRPDLYYRIHGVRLHVPALRERLEDVPSLIWHFVNLHAGEIGRRITEIDDELLRACARHDWPGNVRQLRNLVRSALVLGEGETLSLADAPDLLDPSEQPGEPDGEPETALTGETLSLHDLERQAVIEALRRTNAHQARAARLLGISDRTLRDKIRRYRRDGHLSVAGEETWSATRAS
ncbi:MAG: sigma-54-dependent Fis family transcriptional regulator [Phycisphaerae bacterium]|nr:sigma-54-dependent Fis family transcriptional regulator [Phycisphaerae bacterium]